MTTTRGNRTITALASLTVAIVGVLTIGAPSNGGTPPQTPTGVSASTAATPPGGATISVIKAVRLVTGDRVLVTQRTDGTTSTAFLPGSPHQHGQTSGASTSIGSFLIPRLPVAERAKLDASLFNVTALASLKAGQVPISITFAEGVVAHPIAGLHVALSTARPLAAGGTVVAGSYQTSYGGVSPAALSGVSTVSLPAGRSEPVAKPATTHTLTIHVTTAEGGPASFAQLFVENVDDSRRYLATPSLGHGVIHLQVPDGNYAVLAYTFSKLVEAPEFAVAADTEISLNLADATVKPQVTVPTYSMIDSIFSIGRYPESGFSFALTFGGPHFFMRVQPAAGQVEHGTFTSGVSGTFVPQGDQGAAVHKSLAVTADARPGVPGSLTFVHPRSDFASVVQHFRSNGPPGQRLSEVAALMRNVDLQSLQLYAVRVPSQRTVLFQASPRAYYLQDYYPNLTPDGVGSFADLSKVSQYRSAGAAPGVAFAYGPVGPGPEARYDGYSVGRYCSLCRFGNHLNGDLPLFNGSGAAMFGFLGRDEGGWSLRHDGQVLAAGHGYIFPHVVLPAASRPYALIATSHPISPLWQLSTNVKDVWTFSSGEGRAVVPILLPSYLPRTAPNGSLGPGWTTFRLDFGNLGPIDSSVVRALVRLSTDGGATWQPAQLTRLDKNSFRVGYDNPPAAGPRRFMSLRVTGTDAGGRRAIETAMRVYRLVP